MHPKAPTTIGPTTEPRITHLPGGGWVEQYPDGRVARITPVSKGDCLPMSVHWAYGYPYDELPHCGDAADPVWRDWTAQRGRRWWASEEYAPICLRRWIAAILKPNGVWHAVAMTYDRLLRDPSEPEPHERERAEREGWSWVQGVGPKDVRRALALIPADQKTLGGRMWKITLPATRKTNPT